MWHTVSKKNFNILLFSILIILSISVNLRAEFEHLKYNNPGLVVDLGVGLWAYPLPMDYDQDGDYDLLVSCNDKPNKGIYIFENVEGDVKMPVFEPAKKLGKSMKYPSVSYVDGEMRLLDQNMEFVDLKENAFKKKVKIYPKNNICNKDNKIRANQWKYADFDDDGDLDLIIGVGDWTEYGWDDAYDSNGVWQNGPPHGYVYLIRNDGNSIKPEYAKPSKIMADSKPIDVYGMPSPNIEDFDDDGDLDILCGSFVDELTYFENIGTSKEPEYASGRLLEYQGQLFKMDLCMIVPVAIDWDKDGDFDLIVSQEDGSVSFVENTGKFINGTPQFLLPRLFQQKADAVKYGALVTPYSCDWDGDGDLDLVCGNTAGNIGFIENLGRFDNKIRWAKPVNLKADGKIIRIMAGYNGSIQGPAEKKWGYTVLAVADWDHDGLLDIVVNTILGKIVWFKNVGEKGRPKLMAQQDIEVEWSGVIPKPSWNWQSPKDNVLVTQWRTSPIVFDINKDGLDDLVVMDHEGYLAMFERFKKDGKLKLKPGRRIFNGKGASVFDAKGLRQNSSDGLLRLNNGYVGRSGRRKLCLADWDLDGKMDLLVNSINVNFLKNIAEKEGDWLFCDMGPVGSHLLAGHTTCPTTLDLDSDGVCELLIGAEDGFFYCVDKPNYHN